MGNLVFSYLKKLEIKIIVHKHPPVYTVEEASNYRDLIQGTHCKNLFLYDAKRNKYYLLTTPANKIFRLNEIRKLINAKKLSFASVEDMLNIIGLEAGSASPFGLLNDKNNKTLFLVDTEVWNSKRVTFHPNTNTMTLEMSGKDFQKYIMSLINTYQILTIEEV